MDNNKNSKFYILLPMLLAIALAIGILTGATMVGNPTGKNAIGHYEKLREVLTYIEKDYVDPVDVDGLVETAISNMLEKLDPHSVYIPSEDLALVQSQLEGEFEGIGIEFSIINDTLYVVTPLNGGPSEKAGIIAGDKIVKVNSENIAAVNLTNRDVFDKLRGEKGSTVKLTIKRRGEDELLEFDIVRDKIPQHSVDVGYMVDNQVGYIKISRFSANTYDEFKAELVKLKAAGMKKLVLDLQGNPGGYMDRAINIADEFISGNKLIVYTDGNQDRYDSENRASRDGMFEEGPLVVLIDEGSASASEIVSGAIQDNDRGLIVGRRSFGKGLVQMPIDLRDGSELRLTISRYYTPSGRSIQKPYDTRDAIDYSMDIAMRYEHGEFFTVDSIQFNDSLKYKTAQGRVVYGGGGIMPDYFVPYDTAMNSRYLNKLFNSNALREYTLHYYERNRERLEKMRFAEFRNTFVVSDQMLQELVGIAERANVRFDKKGYIRARPLIKTYVKAYIARSVWGDEGYYPIINKTNEAFQKALELFDEAGELASNS